MAHIPPPSRSKEVALRKESVDRNTMNFEKRQNFIRSLSARRAWIEIPPARFQCQFRQSLSARRAWIEIRKCNRENMLCLVALRKESVDRNNSGIRAIIKNASRSPQGERG